MTIGESVIGSIHLVPNYLSLFMHMVVRSRSIRIDIRVRNNKFSDADTGDHVNGTEISPLTLDFRLKDEEKRKVFTIDPSQLHRPSSCQDP